MNILSYEIISALTFASWAAGICLVYFAQGKAGKIIAGILLFTGIALLAGHIGQLWVSLERAPLRTLGETRLWYSFFLLIVGAILFYRWKMKWILLFSVALSAVFICINILTPENFDKTLMPALQSVWFVPHVIVYIFAYSLLAASTLIALRGLYQLLIKKNFNPDILFMADNIVYIGFSFLTFGLLFGALWAKEAWGHYWTWDPKETWSFITWMLYLLYIHFRYHHKTVTKAPLWILTLAFVILLICWFGINYLPSAQNSVHTYSN